MKTRVMMFLAIFFGIVICSLVVAFCSGIKFGTESFGWIIGSGMALGGVAGALLAGIPDY